MILQGDCLAVLAGLEADSVQCVVTSPPYWGLRDYGVAGQLGLEPTPDEYVARMVEVFREVRRVLRKDGTMWLNLGDSYAMGGNGSRDPKRWPKQSRNDHQIQHAKNRSTLANKQLVGAPWRVALALQADGWWLRCDIVWSKPSPMPESVLDRPTRSHEFLFLLTKAANYYYDGDAIRQPLAPKTLTTFGTTRRSKGTDGLGLVRADNWSRDVPIRLPRPKSHDDPNPAGANCRSVWTIASKPYPEAHFATFPENLVKPCILAGSRIGDTVLDPFAGSGTVGVVAKAFGREFVGIELNPDYCAMAERRIYAQNPALPFEAKPTDYELARVLDAISRLATHEDAR